MRRALLLLLFASACDKGQPVEKKQEPPPRPIAPAPYVVRYDCFHSDMPFGKGSQYRNQSFDLGAKTYTKQFYELTGDEPPPDKPAPPPQPVVTPLPDARVAAIQAATEKVLRGGPFKPEDPVPEGTPCTLAISAAGKEVFSLAKAATDEKDAASALVMELHP